ncbi:hypothetical protein [Amphibacillus jilinensis]|uniref:hypothetical protein n=1 Tax=Amphibacillus jilinensis TaxID=1216008 RepID=UPI0002FA4509|nr:hypothetical protein [Amphibacillus jilinensis]
MTKTLRHKKVTFKHVEAEWYNYHTTLKGIAKLRESIICPFDEDPDDPTILKGANSVRHPGNPTERMAIRLTASKRLEHLNEVTEAIETVYNALPDNYKKLVQIRYWNNGNKLTWEATANRLFVNRATAIRWRNEIIQATIDVLGWS